MSGHHRKASGPSQPYSSQAPQQFADIEEVISPNYVSSGYSSGTDLDSVMLHVADSPTRPQDSQDAKIKKTCMGMGDISNLISFVTMLACILAFYLVPRDMQEDGTWQRTAVLYSLSFTLYSFAGGATNWLAVKMLFDKIPFIIGSGVIPRQFKEIRETIKNTIMKTFFSRDFLESYVDEQLSKGHGMARGMIEGMVGTLKLGHHIQDAIDRPDFDEKVKHQLMTIKQKKQDGHETLNMMESVLGDMDQVVQKVAPVMKVALTQFGKEMSTQLEKGIQLKVMAVMQDKGQGQIKKFINVDTVRNEIDKLMTEKLEQLTPEMVKGLLEEVMRSHLGWLIVWGNIFGGLVGVASMAAGFGPS